MRVTASGGQLGEDLSLYVFGAVVTQVVRITLGSVRVEPGLQCMKADFGSIK